MDSRQARRHAFFLHRREFGFGNFGVFALFDKGRKLRIIGSSLNRERVRGGNTHIGNPHQRVWASCIDFQILRLIFNLEAQFYPFRAADPIALHGFNHFWPAVKII